MATVYVALGSNVGDSVETLRRTIEQLSSKLTDIKTAPIYISRAVGYTDQPDFYNTVLKADANLTPQALLVFVKGLEESLGRVHRFRWGPREIDIDIIFYDDVVLESPQLTIPHPRFAERDFVLRPLMDLSPDLRDPRSGHTVRTLLKQLPKTEQAIMRRVD